jgi:TetR/AcrR family transcriptional regulator, transcriptional repressor for nem operon
MMNIMRNANVNLRTAAKDASHERIVDAAARAIRRSGYDGTSVADIMKEAGLTHGAFYAHFDSRETMLAEAADLAGAQANAWTASLIESVSPNQAMQSLAGAYLSDAHLKGVELGCPLAALVSEMSRQSVEVRRAATKRIKETVDLIVKSAAKQGQTEVRHESRNSALVTLATMVGAMVLARAVDDSTLSSEFRAAAYDSLTQRGV